MKLAACHKCYRLIFLPLKCLITLLDAVIKIRTKFIMSTIIVAIGILLIAGAINTDVEAVTPTQVYDCDDDSSADGERLVLTKDIRLDEDCIVISHDNVTLDCNGFMIDGVSDTGIVVKVMADGVTVKNCTIRNFEKGINLVDSDGSTKLVANSTN